MLRLVIESTSNRPQHDVGNHSGFNTKPKGVVDPVLAGESYLAALGLNIFLPRMQLVQGFGVSGFRG